MKHRPGPASGTPGREGKGGAFRGSAALVPLSWPYALVTRARRAFYARRAERLPVPVLSLGNLSCGGTGKTPAVEMLSRDLLQRGRCPAILSRGYAAVSSAGNDEAFVLRENLPEVAHYQDRDRVRAGRRAIGNGADVIVLDDGFQHVRLARDLDIVLLDSLSPPTRDRVLPAGLLREPLAALGAADLIAWTRTELLSPDDLDLLAEKVRIHAPRVPQIRLRTRVRGFAPLAADAEVHAGADRVLSIEGRRVFGFCGIGNPRAFRLQLEALGGTVVAFRPFRDHHSYRPGDVVELARLAKESGAEVVALTQKDAVKLRDPAMQGVLQSSGLPWLVLLIASEIAAGAEAWGRAVSAALAPREASR